MLLLALTAAAGCGSLQDFFGIKKTSQTTLQLTGIVIHSDQSTNFAAQLTCRCTVEGRTGTFTLKLDGTGDATAFAAHWRIVAATGGLAGLRGEGTLAAPPPTYSGELHFE